MARRLRRLWNSTSAAVAPTVALSLAALVGVGGLAFDYARLAAMDTELQQAADQAALAAATQLDGKSGAASRAVAAAQGLLVNRTLLSNDGGGTAISTGQQFNDANGNVQLRVVFYATKADAEANTNAFATTATNADALAKYVKVDVAGRRALYAMTPVLGVFQSSMIGAAATAGLASAICKVPPVMICNPDEPPTNNNEDLVFTPTVGSGLRLVTGNADAPGNFGWLEAGLQPGAPELAQALGYNSPPGECQEITGVTTQTGMETSVLNAFNTRFDIYSNGNMTCPSQGAGICSPSLNTRKDLVCNPNDSNTGCNNDQWSEPNDPYRLPEVTTTTTRIEYQRVCTGQGRDRVCEDVPVEVTETTTGPAEQALPTDGTQDPSNMGYPRDLCHMWERDSQTCGGASGVHIRGNGNWDRDAYFRVNYGWDRTAWTSAVATTPKAITTTTPTRWQVYQWELAHAGEPIGGQTILAPKIISGTEAAFSQPATGRTGVGASSTQADRRRISVAVLNCIALNAHGKTTNVPVPTWMDVFLVEPAMNRGQGQNVYTDQKDVYVEMIGVTTAGGGGAGQVVRRDVPYLVR